MRDRLLGLCGVAITAGAAVWSLAGGPAAAIATLVLIGWVLAAADAVLWGAAPHSADDLALPVGVRARGPPWGLVIGAAAGLGMVAAVAATALPLAGAAAVLLAVTLAGPLRRSTPAGVSPSALATAARLRTFARSHGIENGQQVDGYVTSVGNSGARLVVVAADGVWAEAMLRPADVEAVARTARIQVHDSTDLATGHRLRTGPQLWQRMTKST